MEQVTLISKEGKSFNVALINASISGLIRETEMKRTLSPYEIKLDISTNTLADIVSYMNYRNGADEEGLGENSIDDNDEKLIATMAETTSKFGDLRLAAYYMKMPRLLEITTNKYLEIIDAIQDILKGKKKTFIKSSKKDLYKSKKFCTGFATGVAFTMAIFIPLGAIIIARNRHVQVKL
jgi:hypothetical protein